MKWQYCNIWTVKWRHTWITLSELKWSGPDWRMAHPPDLVLSHHTSQERQPAAVPEVPNDQPYQSPKQSHTEQIEATSGEDHRWRAGMFQSGMEHHRADLQPTNPLWEILPAPARPLPCLNRLQEGLWQGLACSFVGNHEEEQHQHQPHPSHQNLYDKATSAVLFNRSIGDCFRTTVEVRQGCLLSPTLFNKFL